MSNIISPLFYIHVQFVVFNIVPGLSLDHFVPSCAHEARWYIKLYMCVCSIFGNDKYVQW